MNEQLQTEIIDFINEETRRISYGKLFIEVTIANGRATNVQCETKRSKNINSFPGATSTGSYQ